MTTYVLIYEGYAHFEITIPTLLLSSVSKIVTVGLTMDQIKCGVGFQYTPHCIVGDVSFEKGDVLLIPGGDPEVLYNHPEVYEMIRKAHAIDVTIGAICFGPVHLAKAGILDDREYTTSMDPKGDNPFDPEMYVNENVVVDGHIITAKPTGYVDFGIILGDELKIYESEADYEETVKFFRDFDF